MPARIADAKIESDVLSLILLIKIPDREGWILLPEPHNRRGIVGGAVINYKAFEIPIGLREQTPIHAR